MLIDELSCELNSESGIITLFSGGGKIIIPLRKLRYLVTKIETFRKLKENKPFFFNLRKKLKIYVYESLSDMEFIFHEERCSIKVDEFLDSYKKHLKLLRKTK